MQTNNSMPMPLVSDVVVVKQEFQPIAFMGTADVPVEVPSTVYHSQITPQQSSHQPLPIQQNQPLPQQRPHQPQIQQQHQKSLPVAQPQYLPVITEQQLQTQPVINNLLMAKPPFQASSSQKPLHSAAAVNQNNISAAAAVARSPVNNKFNS